MRWTSWCLLCGWIVVSARGADDLTEGRALLEQRRYAEAQQAFEKAAATDPSNGEIFFQLGRLARMRQDWSTAVEQLEKAVQLQPENAAIQYEYGAACGLYANTLGFSLRAASWARKGRTALEKAAELAPDENKYRIGLVEFYRTAPSIVGGSMAKALEQANLVRQKDTLAGGLLLVSLYLQQKRFHDALDLARQVLDQHPDHPQALFRFGETAAHSREDTARGIAALERVLTLTPSSKGNHDAPPALIHWRLGQLRETEGDVEGARSAYRAALEHDPNLLGAATDLARLPPEKPRE